MPNRLIHEKSPYLLQHAHNPVDWYPWGEEAFGEARINDKPIFLSIGYSTCHWCHVMEKESFKNSEIAQLLNKTFINIKVDREELPEVDSLYMELAQGLMSGSAGWPLNLVLTPHLLPFFAATYLPPKSIEPTMGLDRLITQIESLWNSNERESMIAQSEKIVELYAEASQNPGTEVPHKSIIDTSIELLLKMSDPVFGGMQGAPKFPIGFLMNLMMHYASVYNDSRALFFVERTLDRMHRGGIYDHLGGGFSRYSVDDRWLIPHFEKMLYDNALLAQAYTDAWCYTKDAQYQRISEEIIDYILREMTDDDGGFYSAEDADSDGVEGKYYSWTVDEVFDLLGPEKGEMFCDFYGATSIGNFEGKNVFHTPLTFEEFSIDHSLKRSELKAMKNTLLHARNQRIHPLKDDKVICSWNGLMIHTLAQAGCSFKHKHYLLAAQKAASFIHTYLWNGKKLLRRYRDGESNHSAGLDDYAAMIRALLTLFEAGLGSQWLRWALELEGIVREKFTAKGRGFYQTDGEDYNLLLRRLSFSDGAEPSGNAIHCENLLRLYLLTHNSQYLTQAETIFSGVESYLSSYPPGYSFHLRNLIRYYQVGAPTIVIALNKTKDFFTEIRNVLYQNYSPHRSIVWKEKGDREIQKLLPYLTGQPSMNENTTVYVCQGRVCEMPLTDIHQIREALAKLD